MLKNKKGFTLIESIITIAIFAILGTMLVTGFSTVIRHMGEAAQIKNSINRVLSDVEKAGPEESTESTDVSIEIDGNGTIREKVKLLSKQEKIDASFSVKLRKFYKEKNKESATEKLYKEIVEFLEDIKKMSDAERIDAFNKVKEELIKEGIDISYPLKPGLSNDNFRWYYYVVGNGGVGYPEIDSAITAEANRIYDEMNPGYPNNKARIGNENLYMKPYYMQTLDKIVFSAETQDSPHTWDGWKCRLLFNPDDMSWYYKVAYVNNEYSEHVDSSYSLANLYKMTASEWQTFKQQLQDHTKWRKINVN